MKLKNIFISGISLLALAACNDYLEVDAPSKFSPETIYKSTKDVGTALNGVYAEILASNTFGQAYTYSLVLNSDVDFASNSNENKQTNTPKRYDMDATGSTANSVWNATYSGIETANNFIYYLGESDLYKENNENFNEVAQYMGEAKVIRAMLYFELLCYWGDVPFTLLPTSATENFTPAITSRDIIARQLMDDLIAIAPYMRPAAELSEGIERISKEACWAMIARIGLQAAGYSLRHAADDATSYGYMGKPSAAEETWFLTNARAYADSVINKSNHTLALPYQEVFLNECNFKVVSNDDPLFEIPFAKESSGSIGYRQGPQFRSNGGSTNYEWGESNGGQQIEAFYRFCFKPGDMRKNATVGWWYYTYDGIPKLNNGYSLYNNKWSKMFNITGAFDRSTTSNTGINYPYLRLADVLLMYAEADVKLTNTVGATAVSYVQQVRDRAYKGSSVTAPLVAATDSASFMDEILQERKWEFAGENMRWKDLVRNNKLAEVLYHTFMRYNAVASEVGGVSESAINDIVVAYDGVDYFGSLGEKFTQDEIDAAVPGDLAYGQTTSKDKGSMLASKLYYCWIENPNDNSYFANNKLPVLYLFNPASTAAPKSDYKTPAKFKEFIEKEYNNIVNPDPTAVVTAPNPEKKAKLEKLVSYKWIPNPEEPSATLKNDMGSADFFNWFYPEDGFARNQVLYSFYGFIHGGATSDKTNYYFVRDGREESIGNLGAFQANPTNLPVVRYLMPIPREAITRSAGVYKNYYGY
jgi:hypothetical protein